MNLRAVWTDKDDRYNLIAYVNNVFDKLGFDRQTGSLLQTGNPVTAITTNYSLLNPRTYGVEVRYRFH